MSGLKHVQSATSDLSSNEHHFNFVQVSSKSALLHVQGLPLYATAAAATYS